MDNRQVIRATVIVLVLLAAVPAAARADDIDPWEFVYAGMEHLYNLEYDQAIEDYEQAVARDPENIRFLNLLANGYLFRELYRLGLLDGNLYSSSNAFLKSKKPKRNSEQIKLTRSTLGRVRKLCDARLKVNSKDTEALYALGVVHSMEATIAFTLDKKFMAALRAGTTANRLHEKVLRIDPEFHDAKLITGVYQYVVGSLPLAVKILAMFIGHRGDKAKGIQMVKEAMLEGKLVGTDATVLLALGYEREKQHPYARQLLEKLMDFYPRNYLYRLEIGNSYKREGNREEALKVYLAVAQRNATGAPGYNKVPVGRLYFEIGTMQQAMEKLDDALRSFTRTSRDEDTDGLVQAFARLRRGTILLQLKQTEDARAEFERVARMSYDEPKRQARVQLRKLGG
jgi:tetratricopeptide (TPR) repeat protein